MDTSSLGCSSLCCIWTFISLNFLCSLTRDKSLSRTSSSAGTCPSAPFRPPSPSSASGPPVPQTLPWRPAPCAARRSRLNPSHRASTQRVTCSCSRTLALLQSPSPRPPSAPLSPRLHTLLYRPTASTASPHQLLRLHPVSAPLQLLQRRLLHPWTFWPLWHRRRSLWKEEVGGNSVWPNRAFCSPQKDRVSTQPEVTTATTPSAAWTPSGASASTEMNPQVAAVSLVATRCQ